MHRRIFNLGRIASLIAVGTVMVAQGVQYGNLAGTVKDQKGNPISGARIVVHTPQGDRAANSGADGSFRLSQLVPQSSVQMEIRASGFLGQQMGVTVSLGNTKTYEITLKTVPNSTAGAVVVVTAANEAIDTTEAKSGANMALDTINALPINNRNIATIARLSPGTSVDSNGVTIRGSQATQVQYLVDGADVMDPVTGGSAVRLNEEMLEEVQVISGNVSAEYGRFTGGVVNTVTKSGSNEWKGVLRWDITNSKWNAYNPKDRGASNTYQFPNHHAIIQQYFFSGPIWKDHIFFAVGYRTTSPMGVTTGSTSAEEINGGGQPFATTSMEERKDIKLDYQITPAHKVFWQYNWTDQKRKNIDYATRFFGESTTLATLSSQADRFSYITWGYLGQLTNSLMLDLRLNNKQETLGGTGGGQGPKNAPMWIESTNGTVYDNGVFADGGDSRPIKTANASLTYFFDAAGSHELKGGYQWFQSSRNSGNAQTPSDFMIWFNGYKDETKSGLDWHNRNLDTFDDSGKSTLEWYEPMGGATTKNEVVGYFVNDKWKVNRNLTLNLGVRYDKFTSKDDRGKTNYTYSDYSPRLAAIWDVNGDGLDVVSLSRSVYVGQVIQGATDDASPVGNPIDHLYYYIGNGNDALNADGSLHYSAFGGDDIKKTMNGAHDADGNPTQWFLNDSNGNRSTTIDKNLKSPRVIEYAIDYKHSDGSNGTFGVNLTTRKWDRFVTGYKQTYADIIDPATGSPMLFTVIKNDADIYRTYQGLEVTYRKKASEHLNYGFQATISSLRGNFEGGQTGASDQRRSYGAESRIPMDQLAPSGYLSADKPLQFVGDATYSAKLGKANWSIGVMEYYTSGSPYSIIGSSASASDYGVTDGYTKTYSRYFGDRGTGRYPDWYRTDIQVSFDMPIFSRMEVFGRINITNAFNHQMLINVNTTGSVNKWGAVKSNGANDPNHGNATAISNPNSYTWAAGPSFGRPTAVADFLLARTINIAGGIRF